MRRRKFLIQIQLPNDSLVSGMSNLADHLALKAACDEKIMFHTHSAYLNAAKTMLICPWVSLSLSTLKLISLIDQDPRPKCITYMLCTKTCHQ
jgi:hypothetical protein